MRLIDIMDSSRLDGSEHFRHPNGRCYLDLLRRVVILGMHGVEAAEGIKHTGHIGDLKHVGETVQVTYIPCDDCYDIHGPNGISTHYHENLHEEFLKIIEGEELSWKWNLKK